MTITCWIGIGIPFRPCQGTYGSFSGSVPPIKTSKYQTIKTLQDLQRSIDQKQIDIESSTACYFDLDPKTGVFYRDQQDCVIWKLTENGQVDAITEDNEVIECVADSLPEFLNRIEIENHIWFQCDQYCDLSVKETISEKEEIWSFIQHNLDQDCIEYLKFYKDSFDATHIVKTQSDV
jgi:hypothetical protein